MTLPADAEAVVREYARRLMAGEIDGDGPCCWLDQEAKRCRWYSHRPQICRDLIVWSKGCRAWRGKYNTTTSPTGQEETR
jgi:Fe-S-cluster containining protein